MTPSTLTALEAKTLLELGEISCAGIMRSVLERMEAVEPKVRAYLSIRDRAELMREAEEIDRRRLKGEPVGPLAGLPIAIKDNLVTRGLRTTCASKMLANYVPPYDATPVARIRAADGVVVGKTNLDEFAMGSTTEYSAFQLTRNPHHGGFVPGGTSGGSAAAVASDEAFLALGSDTGGSVRQPASFCGVVGLKPTYGRVSRYGLVAHASSFDQVGTLTKSVADAALLLRVVAGRDPCDATSAAAPVPDYLAGLEQVRKLRFGVPRAFLEEGVDPEVRSVMEGVTSRLAGAGHELVDIELPNSRFALAAYYVLVCSEASSNLARFDGVRYGYRAPQPENLREMYQGTRGGGFGIEVKRRIILGTYALSAGYYEAYYAKASRVRALIARDFADAFRRCDLVLHPVSPAPPFRFGERLDDPLSMYLADIYTILANLAGLPAVSVPSGWSSEGLPIGLQLAAPAFQEDSLLAGAHQLERLLAAGGAWNRRTVCP